MGRTTRETRRQSYDAVLPKREKRCRLILETLGAREMTASEITEELVAAGGIGFCGLLAIAFIVLKLTGFIDWSWLWVLAPLWIPVAIFFAVALVILIVVLVKMGVEQTEERRHRQEHSRSIDEEARHYGLERQPGETDLKLKQRIAFFKQEERRAGRR